MQTNQIELLNKALEKPGFLSAVEAEWLLYNCPTDSLVSAAGAIRDTKRLGAITYSRKVFINIINLCRDTCSYCTYKQEPGDPLLSMLNPDQALAIAEAGRDKKCTEALLVTGERPEQKYPEAKKWLHSLGFESTVEYLADISEKILQKTGLFPHTNAGSMTKKEMTQLQKTNVSMGVMLESSSERLVEKGMAHEGAPSKNPKVRIKTLQSAGELRIPMTTGILVGIGENESEMVDSLFTIKNLHQKYGHIQEVILQNFEPKPDTAMKDFPSTPKEYFLRVVALARLVMPDMNIQVPPNLNPGIFARYLDAGINDWGGISPVTIDHVNPEFPWPTIESVKGVTQSKSKTLRARLPIYPEFIKGGFISSGLQEHTHLFVDESGLVREDYINGF
ncbi:MAG: 7,8-didemethyl-8-hydroxy-5-deazariboflavin synthase subunit CofG [Nitrososphaera sp.]|nr:7,8-didemethyl-8-hydroxy-5-deazariboflavin synthase subunit CofG [Nitrososphaera sp.]